MNIDPPPHSGINVWMLSTARKCQLAGMPLWEAESRIRAFDGSARRPFKEGEIKRALEKAYSTVLTDRPSYVKKFEQKWNPRATKRSPYRRGAEAVDLWEASPWRMDGGTTQKHILELLFPNPEGLVCVGKSTYEFHTAHLGRFRDLTACQFIVPCYMTKRKGLTQDNKESMHCLDNCGPRRFAVCDFDEPASDLHPSIIWHLKKVFPLVMALSSGGKSLHAWFNIPESEELDFWKAAIECGADAAIMRNRSSFVRMPEGTRDNGAKQSVIYFDPSKIPA